MPTHPPKLLVLVVPIFTRPYSQEARKGDSPSSTRRHTWATPSTRNQAPLSDYSDMKCGIEPPGSASMLADLAKSGNQCFPDFPRCSKSVDAEVAWSTQAHIWMSMSFPRPCQSRPIWVVIRFNARDGGASLSTNTPFGEMLCLQW